MFASWEVYSVSFPFPSSSVRTSTSLRLGLSSTAAKSVIKTGLLVNHGRNIAMFRRHRSCFWYRRREIATSSEQIYVSDRCVSNVFIGTTAVTSAAFTPTRFTAHSHDYLWFSRFIRAGRARRGVAYLWKRLSTRRRVKFSLCVIRATRRMFALFKSICTTDSWLRDTNTPPYIYMCVCSGFSISLVFSYLPLCVFPFFPLEQNVEVSRMSKEALVTVPAHQWGSSPAPILLYPPLPSAASSLPFWLNHPPPFWPFFLFPPLVF